MLADTDAQAADENHLKLTVWGAIARAAATASEVAARIPYAVPLPPPLPSSVYLPSAAAVTIDTKLIVHESETSVHETNAAEVFQGLQSPTFLDSS